MQLVIDTNVVLDLLVFRDPRTAALADALGQGGAQWIATAAMREELARVLQYPKLAPRVAFHRGGEQPVLEDFDSHTRVVQVPAKAPLTCGDPDDQKFIDLAVAHRCMLLSKDAEVLRMRKRLVRVQVVATSAWPAPACATSPTASV